MSFLLQFQDELRTLLSQSAAFQNWVGAANATEALEYIIDYETDAPATMAKPRRAVSKFDKPRNISRTTTGTGIAAYEWINTRTIVFQEEVDITDGQPQFSRTAARAFIATVSTILSEIAAQESTIGTISEDEETSKAMRYADTQSGQLSAGYWKALTFGTDRS